MKYIIYCTTNNVNGKIYVGIHKTFTPYKFDGYLGCGAYANSTGNLNKHPFQKALKKYGVENFTRKTLAVFDTEYEALMMESEIVNKEFISRVDTYNVTLGGKVQLINLPVSKYDLGGNLLSSYDSINDAAKELKVLPKSIYRACNENNTTCNGYFWRITNPESPVNKILVNNNHTDLVRNEKAVIQYSMAGYKVKVWKSAKEAAFNLHCDRATITAACRGKKKTLKNYQWRYASDKLECLPPIETVGGKCKKIVKLDLNGVLIDSFESITEAAEKSNLSTNSIHKALKYSRQSDGFYWKYV